MDYDRLIDRLLSAARETPAGDGVPYAFEKRIMAHIRDAGVADPIFFWAKALWRAVPVCVAVFAVSLALNTMRPAPVDGVSLQVSFEDAVVQSADFFSDTW